MSCSILNVLGSDSVWYAGTLQRYALTVIITLLENRMKVIWRRDVSSRLVNARGAALALSGVYNVPQDPRSRRQQGNDIVSSHLHRVGSTRPP